MNVMALTHMLAQSIKETPELQNYFAAKAAYEADAGLQEQLFEYETQRKILTQEFALPVEEQHPELISAIRDRLTALAGEIVKSEEYKGYEEAKRAVNDLMSRVNAEISRDVFGVTPSSCTHDCSICGGCASRAAAEQDDAED